MPLDKTIPQSSSFPLSSLKIKTVGISKFLVNWSKFLLLISFQKQNIWQMTEVKNLTNILYNFLHVSRILIHVEVLESAK